MIISTSYYSAIGGRPKNEDTAAAFQYPNSILGVIADGLGGHQSGEIASQTAVSAIDRVARQQQAPSVSGLMMALEAANQAILEDQNHPAMKTTAAILWLGQKSAFCATIGDTRVYQFRDQAILFQSVDHSMAQMDVLAGGLTAEEIRYSRNRHKLVRALGAGEDFRADIITLSIQPCDSFLVCSDGFWEFIHEREMLQELAQAADAKDWLDRMRQRVETSGGDEGDNHSALVLMLR